MKVKFINPVQHGSDLHQVDSVADLPAGDAKKLIAGGDATAVDSAAERATAAKAEAEAKARAEAQATWDKDESLRLQHGNSFEGYLASLVKKD